ncbi:MAG TPA: zinc ribbon domain-containing protein [Blastocatellia bacterium]|nr:zinc ribbon domain-containing protein [Blastocatellia bacterium]
MFCPNCSAEAAETEQKFCKLCGTNLQMIAETLKKGQSPAIETYKLDFDNLKSSVNDLGRGIRAAIQKGQREGQLGKLNYKEMKLKREMLACSRTRNLQHGIVGTLSSIGMGVFFYFFGHGAIYSGTIESLEQMAHITGLAVLARLIWLVALIPFLASVGHLINGIFLSPNADPVFKSAVSGGTTREMNEPPSVTEDTTAFLYDTGQKGA